jgi:Arylsulfotransferase (ASST)
MILERTPHHLRTALWPLAALVATCSGPGSAPPGAQEGPQVDSAAEHAVVSSDWVEIYDPARASPGYTLDLFWGRVPTLVDLNGRIVHAWPEARVRSRVRLLEDGSLLGLSLGRSVVQYDWEGQLTWEFDAGDRLPHHDVRKLRNGNVLVPVYSRKSRADDLLEIDRSGQVVWEWRASERMAHLFTPEILETGDRTHINSIQELPDNPWYRQGDQRFRPGNLLISSRALNAALIIERPSGEIVWIYDQGLDRQHEAAMIDSTLPGRGYVLLFNNGYGNRFRYRSSVVLMLRPTDREIVWSYAADGFYSPTAGLQQPLPNGNLLVASSRGQRTFEITREGEIVWQWAPPFEPVRPERYPYDATPQLRALDTPEAVAVTPPAAYRYVDPMTSTFAPRGGLRKVRLERKLDLVLVHNNDCRRLLLPPHPEVWVSYGVSKPLVAAAGRGNYSAHFSLFLRDESGSETPLLEDTVGLDPPRWRAQTVQLEGLQSLANGGDLALRWVELCVRTRETDAPPETPTEDFAFWSNPLVRTAGAAEPAHEPDEEPLTPEELEAQHEHLRALGYLQ